MPASTPEKFSFALKNVSAGKSEFKHKTVGASKLAPLPCSRVMENHALVRERLPLEAGKAKVDKGLTNFPKSELPSLFENRNTVTRNSTSRSV